MEDLVANEPESLTSRASRTLSPLDSSDNIRLYRLSLSILTCSLKFPPMSDITGPTDKVEGTESMDMIFALAHERDQIWFRHTLNEMRSFTSTLSAIQFDDIAFTKMCYETSTLDNDRKS